MGVELGVFGYKAPTFSRQKCILTLVWILLREVQYSAVQCSAVALHETCSMIRLVSGCKAGCKGRNE
jgi:hypothetical protein